MSPLLDVVFRLSYYNVKIIFGNKFFYFILSAVAFFVLAVVVSLLSDADISASAVYNMLLIPAILLVFYPMCFGIQNDRDAKIIEIIFGIPDYRYKVWLFRILMAYVICFVLLLGLAYLSYWLLVDTSPFVLGLQVMAPTFLAGILCFMLSTIIRNGNGTAVVVVILGLLLYFFSNSLGSSKWNLFLNPYDVPLDKNPAVFYDTLFDNRLILLAASVVFLLIGLYNTQRREKFI